LLRGTAVKRHRTDFFKVKHVRPENDRYPHCTGLQKILAAMPDETAANESDIRRGIKPMQLTHGVADQYVNTDCKRSI